MKMKNLFSFKNLSLLFIAVLMAGLLFSCKVESDEEVNEVISVSIEGKSYVEANGTLYLSAKIEKKGEPNVSYKWEIVSGSDYAKLVSYGNYIILTENNKTRYMRNITVSVTVSDGKNTFSQTKQISVYSSYKEPTETPTISISSVKITGNPTVASNGSGNFYAEPEFENGVLEDCSELSFHWEVIDGSDYVILSSLENSSVTLSANNFQTSPRYATIKVSVTYKGKTVESDFTIEITGMSVVNSSQYFWGRWTRMDNGQEYEISESKVNLISSTENELVSYTITSVTDTSFTCSLGTFKKDTENVLKIGSIPVFRNGGSNIEYSVKLVGFSDSSGARAATAGSVAVGLSGLEGKAKNGTYSSYSETAVSDSDGKLTLHSPVADTENTITVSANDGTTITATVTPKNAGENAGTIAVSQNGRYSLKVQGKITTDTSDDDDYLYAKKTYDMTVTVKNITDVIARPGVITISAADSRISVSGEKEMEIASFKSPSTKEMEIQIYCSSLSEPYIDSGLNVKFEDADGYVWSDFVPLRIFKGTELIQVYAKGLENDECKLNGFVMYPDGKSKYFSVPSGESVEIEVPSFPYAEPYKLAFSGASLGATVQESTEMKYSIGVNISAIQDFSDYKVSTIANLYEPNESEDKAAEIETTKAVVAYLETDDIDFYSVPVNPYGVAKTYKVNHCLEDKDCSYDLTYTKYQTETLIGAVGHWTEAASKDYEGFSAQRFSQTTVEADGSTEVNIYYNRDVVNLTIEANGGQFSDYSTEKNLSGKYGNSIEKVDYTLPRSGYTFLGWKEKDNAYAEVLSELKEFPSKDKTYVAEWRENSINVNVTLPTQKSDIETITYKIEGNTIYFTAQEGFKSYEWYFDEKKITNAITKSCSYDVYSDDVNAGLHFMMVIAKDIDGESYSSQVQIAVEK